MQNRLQLDQAPPLCQDRVATATDDEVMAAYREAFAPPATGAASGDARMIEARMQARSMIASIADAAKTRCRTTLRAPLG
jgi:uncharacterized protein